MDAHLLRLLLAIEELEKAKLREGEFTLYESKLVKGIP